MYRRMYLNGAAVAVATGAAVYASAAAVAGPAAGCDVAEATARAPVGSLDMATAGDAVGYGAA